MTRAEEGKLLAHLEWPNGRTECGLHATEKENNQSENRNIIVEELTCWTAFHCLINMYFNLIGSEKDIPLNTRAS